MPLLRINVRSWRMSSFEKEQRELELIERWPYLFFQKGLFTHFELHTDINVLHALELSMQECGKSIVEFFF